MQDRKTLWLKRDESGLSHHQLMYGNEVIGIIKRIVDAEAIIQAVSCHTELVALGEEYTASMAQPRMYSEDETRRVEAVLAKAKGCKNRRSAIWPSYSTPD